MTNDGGKSEHVDRRGFLQATAAAAWLGITARPGLLSSISRISGASETPRTPDGAIQELLAGNRRFVVLGHTNCGAVKAAMKAGTLKVVAGIYDLGTGRVALS